MSSLDVDSLLTNIPLKGTINICTNLLYNNVHAMERINKSEFENLLSLANQESYFKLNYILYKQKDSVAMGSPLGSTLANVFLQFYVMKWLEQCPNEFKPAFYRRIVDIYFLFCFIIFKRFQCYTTLVVKELLYNNKINFLLLFQK